jgi:FMNH2-dependent dimethyl sulfone monooxygenase
MPGGTMRQSITSRQLDEQRRACNYLFNDNRLKLGVFGINCSGGGAITTAPEALKVNWPNELRLAAEADRIGLEAVIPIARWKGFGGTSNFNGINFETYTWAAGLSALTRRTAIFATSHVPTVHPIVAAKQAVTIDHISGGRFGLNVVCGWFQPEFDMFGITMQSLEDRYGYAAEWLDVLLKLWTEPEEFDHHGRYFNIKGGFSEPKPIQKPYPPIMNAGGSPVAQQFSARYSDLAFLLLRDHTYEGIKRQVDDYRKLAQESFGRYIQLWSYGYVVIRPTEKEAKDYLHYYVVEKGDNEAVDNLIRVQSQLANTLRSVELYEHFKFHFKAGWGGVPMVGTADQVADILILLQSAGINGMLMTFLDYDEGLLEVAESIIPRLEQAGLRAPVGPP